MDSLLDDAAAAGNAPGGRCAAWPLLPAMTLYVCTTCRDASHEVDRAAGRPCAGARLHAALAAAVASDAALAAAVDPDAASGGAADASIRLVGVECLSVCKRSCAVSFAAPGKWTYVYGDLAAETAATILAGARLYAAAADGIIPWKLRPDALKKGVVARVPAPPVLP